MYLYAISAYIRLWHDTSKFPAYIYHVIALGLVILTFLSVLFFDLLGLRNPYFAAQATYFYDGQMLPILLISVYMFLGFTGLNVKYSKAVNIISASTFGIYLIHDSGYVRPILWQQLFKSAVYSNTVFLIPYSIAVSCIVFIACSCIELLRIILLEKNYMKLISKMDPRINKLVESFFSIKLFDMW
jgi:surface polysaccharide O-acyltransferase-like enzyme